MGKATTRQRGKRLHPRRCIGDHARKGPDPATAAKGQRGQKLRLLTLRQGSGGGLTLDAFGGKVRGDGAAGMAGTRKPTRAAFSKGGIIHRAGRHQALCNAGNLRR